MVDFGWGARGPDSLIDLSSIPNEAQRILSRNTLTHTSIRVPLCEHVRMLSATIAFNKAVNGNRATSATERIAYGE